MVREASEQGGLSEKTGVGGVVHHVAVACARRRAEAAGRTHARNERWKPGPGGAPSWSRAMPSSGGAGGALWGCRAYELSGGGQEAAESMGGEGSASSRAREVWEDGGGVGQVSDGLV